MRSVKGTRTSKGATTSTFHILCFHSDLCSFPFSISPVCLSSCGFLCFVEIVDDYENIGVVGTI